MQTVLVILIFGAALSWLVWRGYKTLFQKQTGCGKGCGCANDVTKQIDFPAIKVQKIKQ